MSSRTPATPSRSRAPGQLGCRLRRRGGKKKRRKSFAVTGPSLSSIGGSGAGSVDNDDEPILHEDVEADPLKDAYRRTPGRPGRSLSSTSIESEGLLLDHRNLREQHPHQQQQPFLRARRPSVVVVPAASASSGGRHRASLHINDDNDDDEGAPLLSRSYVGNDPPGYGTNDNISNDNVNVPTLTRTGSGHSSLRRNFLNPFAATSNINYPPSVPGSPPMRPTSRLLELNHGHGNNLSFGDQMLRDELRSPSSPTLRRSDTSSSKINLNRTSNDTLLENRDRERDRDNRDRERGDQGRDHDRGREGSIGSASKRSGGHPGAPSVSGGVSGMGGGAEGENDVCFPHTRGNDDDDLHSHHHYDDYDDGDHQSRNDDGRDTTWRSRPSRRRRVKWPDLAILDEWSRFERESKEDGFSNGRRRAKKIKEPQLINGRLRPVHKSWHRAEEDAPYRFTYFNEEFQSTIHSQTISELVQPNGSFRELFIPDPPVLSDSEDSEEEYNNGGFMDTDDAGLHGDAFSPMGTMGHAINMNSNSGGTVSPAKEPSFGSGTGSGTGTPSRLVRGAGPPWSVPLERSTTQTSEQTSVFRSPPRMAQPGLAQSGAMTPDLPPLTLSPNPATPRQEAVGAVVTMAPVVVPIMADGASGMPVPASQIQSQSRSQSRSQSQLQSQSPPKVKQPRYGERPVWWLDVLSPTEAEMKVLSKAFGIHPLTAEDIIMQEAREKVELFHHYYFVSYRSFDQDPSSETFLDPVNVYVVVFREGVLSFHFSMTPHPANVRRRIRQLSDYMILSSDWISYAIIDDITDVFVPLIQKIEEEVDDIDDAILEMHSGAPVQEKKEEGAAAATAEADTNMLLRVGDCRKRVMSLYRLLGNKADVIKGFAKRCNEHWEVAPRSEIGLYLGDIQDHIVTMTSNLSHYEKILSRAHGNYLAQINIRMNERQEQTADVLGRLTVLGTIVLPMNIITGLWGMNVWVPGQDSEGDLRWFMVITAGLFAFGMACYLIAKRVYQIV
ncbi:manganese resistance protein mnr2 [Ophiostoma piceae UAMH 11346]|uniref:Manganese resistance protein mnr2 n=1 Tax=Ophiostoma piceae (strain UAMH 11346) TaxID=1262450 RepID=S3C4N5_OPHP1|nr:manganese resistance protein mnr2 [Ophiostoma piceae UAMH 11346]